MPFWRKNLTGVIVINDIPDENDDVQLTVKDEKPKKEKKVKVVEVEEPPQQQEEYDPFGDYRREMTWKDHCINNPKVRLLYVMLLCIFFGLILPFILTSTALKPSSKIVNQRGYCFINESFKYRCRQVIVSESICEDAGCCYLPSENPSAPNCFHSEPSEYGYNVLNSSIDGYRSTFSKTKVIDNEEVTVDSSQTSYRLANAEKMELHLDLIRVQTPYGGEMWPAKMVVERDGDDVIRLTLSSPDHEEGTLITDPTTFTPTASIDPQLDVEITQIVGEAFNVTVFRFDKPEEMLFRTIFGPFILGDGYIEFTSTIPSKHVFGMGSRLSGGQSPNFTDFEEWTMNSQDPAYSEASLPSTHPFYMCWEPHSSKVHGVHLSTSTPLQIGTVPAPGFSFRALLGAFQILVMAGPSPSLVSEQLTGLIGRPPLPPYWAFGFHMCRTRLPEDQEDAYRDVMAGMASAMLPQDSDCLDARLSYPDTFGAIPDWAEKAIEDLHVNGSHYLAVSYPYLVNGSAAYMEAHEANILMKLPNSTEYFGSISGSAVGYPDYLDENSFHNWMEISSVVKDFLSRSDGAILLQNSPLNEAEVTITNNFTWITDYTKCSAANPKYCCHKSPYLFRVDPNVYDISQGSICWEAEHASLAHSKHLAHHNSYGMYHTKRVHDTIKTIRASSRPVLLSSSTHPGSGQFGGEMSEGWGSGVDDMRRALQHVLQLSLSGMTLVGALPCGTRNDTDADPDMLIGRCLRNYQMSIFMPLLMSHYELDQPPTNPPDIGLGFASQLRTFMLLRYSLLPYFYTLAQEASTKGVPVVRPLFYDFYDDPESVATTDQFMLGPSIMVIPNFMNDTTDHTVDVPAYMPPGKWYNMFDGRLGTAVNATDYSEGYNTTLNTVPTDINAFLRGGRIIFMQGDLHSEIRHTGDSRLMHYTVMAGVAEKEGDESDGTLYHDDGETVVGVPGYKATLMRARLIMTEMKLKIYRSQVDKDDNLYCKSEPLHSSTINTAIIFGLPTIKGVTNTASSATSFTQDDTTGAVVITDINYNWCTESSLDVTLTV